MEQTMSDNTPDAREDLLRELALRLSTYPGDPRNEDPQLLVGQLPDNLAIPVPVPEKSRILGTLIHSPQQIDIVLDCELSTTATLNFYKERMAESGWNELDEMHPRHGGFVHSGFSPFQNHLTFCKGPEGPAFSITAFERKQGHTDVNLDINFGSEYSPCVQPNRIQQRMAHHDMQNLIPPLEPPKGAKQQGGGGGGGGDSWHSNATLDTDLQLDALAAHYTGQLVKGGWIRTDEGIAGPLAWSTWTLQDEDHEPWNGLFFILKRPGKERLYVLEVRIDWDKKEEKRGEWFSSYTSLG
jgi:hypothetical protein